MSADDLKRAYELIRDNRHDEARDILIPLCKAQPDLLDAWWLLSFALDEPQHIQDSLQQVLGLDPNHTQARERLASLREGSKSASGMSLLQALLVGIVGLVVATSVVFMFLRQMENSSDGDSSFDSLPTLNPLVDSQAALTQVAAARADEPSATPLQRSTLPPTWTPSPTATMPPQPTITVTDLPPILPTPSATLFLPTLEPAEPQSANTDTLVASGPITDELLESTYWYGDGERSMEDVRIEDGYRRHFRVPVRVWIDPSTDAGWLSAADEAIAVVSAVIPLQRVATEAEADIPIYVVVNSGIYESFCTANSTGCASIDISPDKDNQYLLVDSWVRIRDNTQPTPTLIAHELIHALGVIVHSPDPADVMFPEYSSESEFQLTSRDRLVLEILYSLPALGAEFAPPE